MAKSISSNELKEIISSLKYMQMEGFTEGSAIRKIAEDFEFSLKDFHAAMMAAMEQEEAKWLLQDLLEMIHSEMPIISNHPRSQENMIDYLEDELIKANHSPKMIDLAFKDLEDSAPSEESFKLLDKALQLCYC